MPVSPGFQLSVALLLGFTVGAVYGRRSVTFRPADTSVERQQLNMAAAKEELLRVDALLRTDGRFADVHAFVYTGQDSALGLPGRVRTEADLCQLTRAVAGERLRVTVFWHVKILDGE